MLKSINIVKGLSLLTIFFFLSCATYYQKRISFQRDFARGNIEGAQKFLIKNKKASGKKDRLLYFLDRGVVEQMLGNYDSSNFYFEKAYLFSQDFRKNLANDVAGMVSNPMVKPYKGEDYEIVMIHYYKTINYIQLNKLDDALIEVRRINVLLNEQSDKYEGKKYRYKEDAFAHLLMGVIYEAKNDYNNAFIAYRNSYDVYQNVYKEFGVQAPLELKKDILRTASLLGFYQELERYEKEFGMKAERPQDSTGSLVFFWLNGLAPVKGEVSLNLTTTGGGGGAFVFSDDQNGVAVPLVVSNPNQQSQISDLKFVRLAIPKFDRRDPLIQSASLHTESGDYKLQQAENISAIAIANLEDRIFRELATSIGRLAIKQAAEAAARQQNDGLGAAVSLVNALTEKADTRNWQTLPYSISYQRVYLKEGEQKVEFTTKSSQVRSDTVDLTFNIRSGRTTFKTFHSLATSMVGY